MAFWLLSDLVFRGVTLSSKFGKLEEHVRWSTLNRYHCLLD